MGDLIVSAPDHCLFFFFVFFFFLFFFFYFSVTLYIYFRFNFPCLRRSYGIVLTFLHLAGTCSL